MNRVLMIALLSVGTTLPCAAYLDPGTGSALFQAGYLLLLAVLAFASRIWNSLGQVLGFAKSGDSTAQSPDQPEQPEDSQSGQQEVVQA